MKTLISLNTWSLAMSWMDAGTILFSESAQLFRANPRCKLYKDLLEEAGICQAMRNFFWEADKTISRIRFSH